MENYRIEEPSQAIREREYYVSLVLPADELKERWNRIGYVPKPIQLKLF